MSLQSPISIGIIFKSEDVVVPVAMEDNSGNEATGLSLASTLAFKYARASDSTLQVLTPSASQWANIGRGLYHLTLPTSITAIEGAFMLLVDVVAAGYKTFRGFGQVQSRPEDALLEELASSHNTNGTVGAVIVDVQTNVEVFCSPSYDVATNTLTLEVWAHKNGKLVTNPTNCRVTIKEETGAQVVDELNSSPQADGMFFITVTPITLSTKTNFSVRARVTIAGTEYSSGEGFQTFD